MSKPLFSILFTAAVFITASNTTLAEPVQYITDQIYAPVRAEPNEKAKILHNGLASGTVIQVLERNDQTGYVKIHTADNLEGWIRSQYLSEIPVASVQLEQANAQLAELQLQNNQLQEELTAIKQISSSQIDAHERNMELVKETQLLISEKEVLQTDNERLKDRSSQTWFLYGGFMVALSCLLVAIIPRLANRRRNDGWR
jgi:SH3 domain protein